MNCLLISDLHLTANPRDEYRWALFDWLVDEMPKHSVKELFILGDLTEAKDYHSAKLVNRIVTQLLRVYRQTGCFGIWILRGNHDGIDPSCPYFRFLNEYPSINYISTPYQQQFSGREVLMLPHTTTPMQAWEHTDMHTADLVFLHATVKGAQVENGQEMQDGVPLGLLLPAKRAKIYSGDIHVPQKVGPVEYVGAPYPIRFGDKFQGRAVLLENYRKATDLWIPSIKRVTIQHRADSKSVEGLHSLEKGDQVKVRISLAPQDAMEWQRLKDEVVEACGRAGVELCGIELDRVQNAQTTVRKKLINRSQVAQGKGTTQILDEYCLANKTGTEVTAAGRSLLKEAQA